MNSKTSRISTVIIIVMAVLLVALIFVTSTAYTYSPSTPASCMAMAGFQCFNPQYSYLGNIMVNVGQSTGQTWTAWMIGFSPQGTALSANQVPDIYFTNTIGNEGTLATTLFSGQAVVVNTLANTGGTTNTPVPIGASVYGQLWACYTTMRLPNGVSTLISDTGGCTKPAGFNGSIYYTEITILAIKSSGNPPSNYALKYSLSQLIGYWSQNIAVDIILLALLICILLIIYFNFVVGKRKGI